ncbi:MAG: flavodoxin family protein [Deltaproteobacteria bacterium]|nr:MAG: flavodoxin family protein [Deltaproteobacteria bacterium]
MNILIIYTHPNHQSLNYAFLEHTLKGIKENESIINVKVVDLYKEKFDPVLFFDENKKRSDMHTDPKFAAYREQILWAEKMVFIYPIWWGRPPAMLLGYIDQLFSTHFAYLNTGKYSHAALLKGKSVICISTMKGPKNYPLFFLRNAHKILMKKALFNYVGIKKVKFFEFGSVEISKKKQKPKLEKIYMYFKTLPPVSG